jgi:hypothetical protein
MSPTIFEFIRDILLLHWPDDLDADAREEHALFVMKFQQLTAPVMAKGVEDTSLLHLQPARLAERGRRRAGALRGVRGRIPPLARPAGQVARPA